MNYYYFVASLPYLREGEPPPMTLDAFVRGAEAHLTAADRAALAALLAPPAADAACEHPFVTAWRARERQLLNAAARLRAPRLGREAPPPLAYAGFDVSLERDVADAFNQRDPLERERSLDRLRARLSDELAAGGGGFDAAAVFAYAIRLRLAARRAAWDDAAGLARAQTVIEQEARGVA